MVKDKRYLELKDIGAYRIALNLSNYVWNIVVGWNSFQKLTVGSQFVRSIDSISANIAEVFGRYGKKDKIKFYRYSFGSLKESFDWNLKAKIRKIINQNQYQTIFNELDKLPREINGLIKFTNDRLRD